MTAPALTIADLERLAQASAPGLFDAIVSLANEPYKTSENPLPEGAVAPEQLLPQLMRARGRFGKRARRTAAVEIWRNFLTHPDASPPEKFGLADFLVSLYESNRDEHRDTLVELALHAPMKLGLWAGLKRVYKLAEQRLDARVWGALAARFDMAIPSNQTGEVSSGTFLYLRRRAWRFLFALGRSTPALYPQFAVEVLKNYDNRARHFERLWIGTHVVAHLTKHFGVRNFEGRLPADLTTKRPYPDAWKGSPEALMTLLEAAQHDGSARFAIQCLRKDAPERLRDVTPVWLERLGRKNLPSVHEFLIETIDASPEFHKGKLRALNLHGMAVSLLLSQSPKARKWAIEYARAHAQDLAVEDLVEKYLACEFDDTRKFAVELLTSRKAKDVGAKWLGRMMEHNECSKWAMEQLESGFDRSELSLEFLCDLVFAGYAQVNWVSKWYEKKFDLSERDPALWINVLKDKRLEDSWQARNAALTALGKFPVKNLPSAWLLDALMDPNLSSTVATWLAKADSLPGLDIERVKGMVFNPQLRGTAIGILGNRKLVQPRALGFAWLLALARRADAQLRDFGLRTLLEHMKPEDFGDGDKAAGVVRLIKMARTDKDEPVRVFAQSYLRCNHPEIGKAQPESKQYGIKPQLKRDVYSLESIWPFFESKFEDARSFAVAIAKAELRGWGAIKRLFALADHDDAGVRRFAFEALLRAGEADAPAANTPALAELDAGAVFALTESRRRATRDVGMALILRHYELLGGAEKLGRIMESSDRDVRQFAVRLLWERHRPRDLPPGWKPSQKDAKPIVDGARFADVTALRNFLRTLLYGLPPGRAGESLEAAATRHVPASVAKRNVIEVIRDLAVEDHAFARLVAPVLGEFTGSMAKGEWQACLAALARLRAIYPEITLTGQV
ncbi:MAG: hypothetical protein Q8Q09_21970 [Deltaproteobacteria bacterium]|nr:hypothetical protein [Deltaproteobacteria bacterium]